MFNIYNMEMYDFIYLLLLLLLFLNDIILIMVYFDSQFLNNSIIHCLTKKTKKQKKTKI